MYWGYTRVYGVYQPPVFSTAYTHLSDHKEAGYLQALCRTRLRIPTSSFSNTPLVVVLRRKLNVDLFVLCCVVYLTASGTYWRTDMEKMKLKIVCIP